MATYTYQLFELLITIAVPLYLIGIVIAVMSGMEHECGWLTALILAILFTPLIALPCIYASPLRAEVSRQQKLIDQNDEIIKLLKRRVNEQQPA